MCVCASDSGRGSSLLDRAIADRRQLNAMTLPDFSDPETGRHTDTHIHTSDVFSPLMIFSCLTVALVCHKYSATVNVLIMKTTSKEKEVFV